MAKQRLKPKLTREEMNNQYLNSIFEEFMAEKKALGREPDTLKAYQVTFKKLRRKEVNTMYLQSYLPIIVFMKENRDNK